MVDKLQQSKVLMRCRAYIHLQDIGVCHVVEYLKVRFPAAVFICKTLVGQARMLCKTLGQQALTFAQRGWKVRTLRQDVDTDMATRPFSVGKVICFRNVFRHKQPAHNTHIHKSNARVYHGIKKKETLHLYNLEAVCIPAIWPDSFEDAPCRRFWSKCKLVCKD